MKPIREHLRELANVSPTRRTVEFRSAYDSSPRLMKVGYPEPTPFSLEFRIPDPAPFRDILGRVNSRKIVGTAIRSWRIGMPSISTPCCRRARATSNPARGVTDRRYSEGDTVANLIMCGLSCLMSVAAVAISLDTIRMTRWLNRRLDEEKRRLGLR
jgi:hypothetical protein